MNLKGITVWSKCNLSKFAFPFRTICVEVTRFNCLLGACWFILFRPLLISKAVSSFTFYIFPLSFSFDGYQHFDRFSILYNTLHYDLCIATGLFFHTNFFNFLEDFHVFAISICFVNLNMFKFIGDNFISNIRVALSLLPTNS